MREKPEYSVGCPTCGAPVGSPCVRPDRVRWSDPHRERRATAGLPPTSSVRLWTPEEDERLRALVAVAGLTMREVGVMMGRSRNSVVSRCQRLGIHEDPAQRATKRARALAARGARPRGPDVRPRRPRPTQGVPTPTPRNVSLLELEDDACHWPLGPAPYVFCGAPRDPDHRSYCTHHWGRSLANVQ